MRVSESTPNKDRTYAIHLSYDEAYYLIFYLAEARKEKGSHQQQSIVNDVCEALEDAMDAPWRRPR